MIRPYFFVFRDADALEQIADEMSRLGRKNIVSTVPLSVIRLSDTAGFELSGVSDADYIASLSEHFIPQMELSGCRWGVRYEELQQAVADGTPCALFFAMDTDELTPLQVYLPGAEYVLALLRDTEPLQAPAPLMFQKLIIAEDAAVLAKQIIGLVDARAAEAKIQQQAEQSFDPDVLYGQAVMLIRQHGEGSVSFLMRELEIPYSCAVDLMERMERDGIVSRFSFKTGWTLLPETEH